jgi:hypothetical protein
MRLKDFEDYVVGLKNDNENAYGDWGIEWHLVWDADGCVVDDVEMSWPPLSDGDVVNVYRFAEALSAAAFDAARLVGMYVS